MLSILKEAFLFYRKYVYYLKISLKFLQSLSKIFKLAKCANMLFQINEGKK